MKLLHPTAESHSTYLFSTYYALRRCMLRETYVLHLKSHGS